MAGAWTPRISTCSQACSEGKGGFTCPWAPLVEQLHGWCKALAKETPQFSKGRIWHCSINDDVKEVQRKDRKKKINYQDLLLLWDER